MSDKYLISLKDYAVPQEQMVREGEQIVQKIVDVKVVVRQQLQEILRAPGVCPDGAAVCDAVCMARHLQTTESEDWNISGSDLKLLQSIFNVLIKRPHNPTANQYSLSGPVWEELILRVFKPQRVE